MYMRVCVRANVARTCTCFVVRDTLQIPSGEPYPRLSAVSPPVATNLSHIFGGDDILKAERALTARKRKKRKKKMSSNRIFLEINPAIEFSVLFVALIHHFDANILPVYYLIIYNIAP